VEELTALITLPLPTNVCDAHSLTLPLRKLSILYKVWEIWGFHGGEDSSLYLCCGRSVLSPSSGWTWMKMKVKVKLSMCHNWAPRHVDVFGSAGVAPRILDLGTRWRWVVSFTPRPLYPQGKCPFYPLDRRLGGPQSRSWHGSEEENSQPPPEIEP
jgi:hypothetical protein